MQVSMYNSKRNTLLFIAFFLLAGLLHTVEHMIHDISASGDPHYEIVTLFFCMELVIYTVLIIFWIQSVYIRLLPSRARNYMVIVALLMIFYLLLRTYKYRIGETDAGIRFSWYAYYIPMTFIPSLFLMVCICMQRGFVKAKPEEQLFLIPAGVLSGLIITNDLHHIVFVPDQDIADFIGKSGTYTYGITFYITYAWIGSAILIGIILLIKTFGLKQKRNLMYLGGILVVWLILLLSHNLKNHIEFSPPFEAPEIHIFPQVCLASRIASGGSFSGVADAIVTIPSLTTNGFESTEIYDTAGNVKLYLLSYEEAGAITNVDVRKCSQATGGKYNAWWLRSPFDDTDTALCMNGESGDEEIESVNIMLGVRPALKLDLSKVIFSPASMNFSLKPAEYSVTLSGGANAVADPPTGTSQSGLTGAMTTVTYEAVSGYHFAEFTDITQNGITVTRTGDTIVTVSGTPTADTAITVPDAVENNNGPVTGAYADYVNTTKTVKFNGIDWYIIAGDSIAADAGTVTLFARDPISVSKFNTSEDSTYSSSIIKGYLDGLTAKGGSFANVADVIFSTDLTDVGVQGAKLWLLSLEEAETLSKDISKCSMPSGTYKNMNYWYLRTPGEEVPCVAVVSGDTGIIGGGGVPAYINFCVRPALKLDLSAVVFSSESGTFSVAKPIEYAAENRDNPATGPNTQKDQTQTQHKTTVTAPAKVVLSSAKNNKSKTCTVKWKAVSDAKGYEVQYAFDKKFKKKVKTKTAAKTSLKLKKLKKRKTYYVRVRAYQINALGGKIYGDWSKAKKVKIKK